MNNNEKLNKRVKSFFWRLGGMVAVSILAFLVDAETIEALRESGVVVPVALVTIGGLVLGEVTKHVNNEVTK